MLKPINKTFYSKIRVIKLFLLFIFIVFLSILVFLFSYELYLNYENNNKFKGKVDFKKYSSLKDNVNNFSNDLVAGGSKISNTRVKFNLDVSDVEIWSRESFFTELIRNNERGEGILPTNKNLFDYFNVNEENLYIKKINNNSNTENVSDFFRYTLNTLPFNPKLKNILIVGDSFVAGQNIVDENKVWHQIFADKIKERYKDNYFNIISAGRNGWGFYEYLTNAKNIYNFYKYDYLVIGFLPNDYQHFGVSSLVEKDFMNIKPNYINCINGGEKGSQYLLKLYKFFPKTINKFILTYCNKYLFLDSSNERFWQDEQLQIFKNALENLKYQSKVNNFEVVFMQLNPPQNSGIKKAEHLEAYKLISDAGFVIIDDKNSADITKRNDLSGWVNPADWHPSSELSHRYAEDIYNYFVSRFNISNVEGKIIKSTDKYGGDLSIYNYFSYIRPFYFNYEVGDQFVRINNLNIKADRYSSREGYNKNLGNANYDFTNKIYPNQSALCAKINRPHFELGLNNKVLESYNVRVENIDMLESIVIASKDYTQNGEEIINDGYLLKPGEYVNLVIKGSLLIANVSEGCELDSEIKLDKFDIKVSFDI